MQARIVLLGVAVLGLSLAMPDDVPAADYGRKRNNNNNQPENPSTPQVPERPGRTRPAKDKQEKFKVLPVNTVFYLAGDGYKNNPQIKLTATTARNIKEGVTNKVSPEMTVTVKSDPPTQPQP